jgi:hypothetical protein
MPPCSISYSQTVLPSFEFAAVGVAEADVVQSGTELIEPMLRIGGRVPDQRQHEAAW